MRKGKGAQSSGPPTNLFSQVLHVQGQLQADLAVVAGPAVGAAGAGRGGLPRLLQTLQTLLHLPDRTQDI